MKITDIVTEAANPAQQAAIAISMKKAGKKPKTVDEDLTRRGFLRGLGAAAVAGAAGSALAGSGDPGFIRQVQDQHYSMIEKNPRYAKEHQALQLPVARGIVGSSAETNKRWAEKTAELLEKYGVKVNEGVAEGNDDHIWGSQGRFAGDTHVNVGDVAMKMIQVGDIVKYFGQQAEVVAVSKDRKRARITRGGITQDVNTSDLTQLGQGVAEGVDIGQEWVSDTELDQYVPERLQQQWRELLGYDRDGNPSALWANLTGGYEPDVNDPQHRALMVKVANKWFAAKKIPNVKFFNVKDADDELEWLVQIGQQGVAEEASPMIKPPANRFDNKQEAFDYAKEHGGKVFKSTYIDPNTGIKNIIFVVKKEQGVAEHTELAEEFDLIESIVEMIAEHNGVDADVVWADLESLTEDELYVFAVTSDPLMEDWQKANKRDRTDGMSQKAVNAYRRENPGSKLKTAVTTKPSKLKKGGKASKRRKSYCSRSRGQMKMHSISCAKTPDKAICKARRRWNC